jgi:hypothetical protein
MECQKYYADANQGEKISNTFFCLLSNNLLTPAFKPGIGMCQMFWASALIEFGINGKSIMAKAIFLSMDNPSLKAGVS